MKLLCILFCLMITGNIFSQQQVLVQGKLVTPSGDPVPFLTIIFKEPGKAVTSDESGFFEVYLPAAEKIQLIVNDERFRKITTKITTDTTDFYVRIRLLPKIINGGSRKHNQDTNEIAHQIMKEAVKKRTFYRNRFDAWEAEVHFKSTSRLVKAGEDFPRWGFFSEVPDASQLGLINYQESASKLYYRNFPRFYKEEIYDYKEAGEENRFRFDGRLLLQVDIYDKTIDPLGFLDMEILSPLNWGAFFHYDFSLIEEFYIGSTRMSRIKVTPKNLYNRIFYGEIIVSEPDHAICGFDLTIPKSAGFTRIDSLNIRQEFKQWGKDTWMPSTMEATAWSNLYGSVVVYHATAEITHLVQTQPKPILFYGFNQASTIKDHNDFSGTETPTPFKLQPDEKKLLEETIAFRKLQTDLPKKGDSLYEVYKPRIREWVPVVGGTTVNLLRKQSLYLDGIFNDKAEYNTVEGFTWKYGLSLQKKFRKDWGMSFEPIFRISFYDPLPRAKFSLLFYHDLKQGKLLLEGGRYYFQINSSEPVNPLINTLYTLILQQNLMKIYEKRYARLSYEREIFNGFYGSLSVEYASRYTLENRTDFSLMIWLNRPYTPNNPNADDPDYRLHDSRIFKIKAGFTYKFRQKFIRLNYRKYILKNPQPLISIFYTKAIPGVIGSWADFDLIEFSYAQDFRVRIFGKSSLIFKGGAYINNSRMTYMDYTQFLGERTFFLGASVNGTLLDQFRAIEAYRYNTNIAFVELHYEHDFKGFPFNLVPGFKKLKWNPLAGINFLQTFGSTGTNYAEAFFGINNILGGIKALELFNIRTDVAISLLDGQKVVPNFLFGLSIKFEDVY